MIREENIGKVILNLSCKCKVHYLLCILSLWDTQGLPNTLPFTALYGSHSLCPFVCSSLSRIVVGVRVYGGQAGPAGRPVLCVSLIKHCILILLIPLSSSLPSYIPVMHSGLVNYSGVSRSACSVLTSFSVGTSCTSTYGTVYSSTDALFALLLMKGC